MTKKNHVPDTELLIASGCVHCPVVLSGLADLLKQGRIGRLDVINIAAHPELAAERNARSVPWMRIGPFELTGAHSVQELADWVDRAGSPDGRRAYLLDQLGSGQLDQVTASCRRDTTLLSPLLALAADLETPFAVRIGVGAVLEDLSADDLLGTQVGNIVDLLARSPHAQVRAEAAHFLGLTGSDAAADPLQSLLHDEDAEVREIAQDSLDALADT